MQKGVILGCGNRSNVGMDTVTLVVPHCNICNNTPIQKKPRISLPEVNFKVLKFG
jgi:hypothetical protein